MFHKVTQNSATDDIVQQIVSAIESGELKENQRLPSERQLSELFQVSRATIREALKHLMALGYIETRRGLGNFVQSNHSVVDQNDMSPEMLMEARFAIEPYLVQLCTVRATGHEIEEMENILARCERDPEHFETYDNEFHFAIASAARNVILAKTAEGIYRGRSGALWGHLKASSLTPERRLIYNEQHHNILNAIRERNPERAHYFVRTHLLTASHALFGTWPQLPVLWERPQYEVPAQSNEHS
ncbi:MAG: FadR/GntR family transcriptional regulator [Firmicutes bacterium]|nr:FadR/GntR family transcriptional regulator [Bacillota bacterium]